MQRASIVPAVFAMPADPVLAEIAQILSLT